MATVYRTRKIIIRHNYKYKTDIKKRCISIKFKEVLQVYFFEL